MEWPLMVALVIGIPVILFVPALVWIAVVSGLTAVIRENLQRRVSVRHGRLAESTENVE